MEDLEQSQEEFRGDMNQLKDQITQLMEMLKSLKKEEHRGDPFCREWRTTDHSISPARLYSTSGTSITIPAIWPSSQLYATNCY